MYHIVNPGVEEAIVGSSNFTVRGLGLRARTRHGQRWFLNRLFGRIPDDARRTP
jgi:hypothetical protein